jgi:hypothetical protein
MCANKTFWQYFQIYKLIKHTFLFECSHFIFKIYVCYIIKWCSNHDANNPLNNSPFVFACFPFWRQFTLSKSSMGHLAP